MKTAEEILKVITCNGCMEIQEERSLQAVKEYAKEVAREALKKAAENACLIESIRNSAVYDTIDKSSILNDKNIPEL